MRASWTEIEKARLDVVEIIGLLADGKSFDEIRQIDATVDLATLRVVFERVEMYLRMHLLLDEMVYLDNMSFSEQMKFYKDAPDESEMDEIERLIANDFSIEKIAKIFIRDKNEISQIIENISNRGVKDGGDSHS